MKVRKVSFSMKDRKNASYELPRKSDRVSIPYKHQSHLEMNAALEILRLLYRRRAGPVF